MSRLMDGEVDIVDQPIGAGAAQRNESVDPERSGQREAREAGRLLWFQ